MVTQKFELSQPQLEIFMAPQKNKIVVAGRRFGKSFTAGTEILNQVQKKKGSVVWYVAPTWDMAKSIMWDSWFKKYIPPQWIKPNGINKNDKTYEFKNGSILYVKSAENPERLRGSSIDLCIFDECAFMKEGIWDIVSPALADKYCDGRAIFISTPQGYNWFYDLYQNTKDDPDWAHFHYTSIEGGNINPKEIEEKRRTMSVKMFNQEFNASFETLSNRVYENYDGFVNRCEYDEDWQYGDIHVGIDFNVNPMTAVIAKLINGTFYIFDEIYEPNSNTQWLANLLKQRYPKAEFFVYPDPTCKKRQTSAAVGTTDYSILKDNGFHVLTPKAPYPSRDKFNSVNAAMCNAKGERRILIADNTCPHLKKALNGYCYKDNGEDTDKSTGLDHISDAMAYMITYRMPIKGRWGLNRPRVFGV